MSNPIEGLVKALRFYADGWREHFSVTLKRNIKSTSRELLDDEGKIARAALTAYESQKQEEQSLRREIERLQKELADALRKQDNNND